MKKTDGIPDDAQPASGAAPLSDAGVSSNRSDETFVETSGELSPATEVRSIGPYRLVKKLGEGGMGQVWLAEQSVPLQRRVALKLVKAGMFDDSMLQRFLAERQSLAIMNHPSIAKVFDAGATSDGQPYFVMEYVPGLQISTYCDLKGLRIKQRLELFIKVCEGVQHAHQKAIIHRDLKPANILVVEVDGKPTPRIIDFGLAKSATPNLGAETMLTQIGGLVGTPGFISPEQADPSFGDVDTRTDVFSLGAILYVLLTSSLPFDPAQWKGRPFHEILRRLREEDPPTPSTKINSEPGIQATIAKARQMAPAELVTALRGDLDWITMKALEKDRARRYGTPSELAADLQRYLNNQPVLARPATAGYRLRKYVARHRIGAAVVAGLAVVLAAFVITQAVQLSRIRRERDRADRVTEFMTGMFRVSDPSEARGNSVTAREILDRASKDIDSSLAKDPELRAKMMDVMGQVYENLGLYSQAHSLVAGAAEIKNKLLGPDNLETLTSQNTLVAILTHEGNLKEAETLGRQTLERAKRTMGPNNPNTLKSMTNLGIVLTEEGRYQEAETIQRQALDIASSTPGSEDRAMVNLMTNLSSAETNLGHFSDAEKLVRDAIVIQRRVVGPEHPETLDLMNNLSAILNDQGRAAEAEAIERELVETYRRILGPEHPSTLRATMNLANYMSDQGRYHDAEILFRQTLEIQRRTLGPKHLETMFTQDNLANSLSEQGQYQEAEALEREVLDQRVSFYGSHNPLTAESAYNLACMFALQGRREEALSWLRQSMDYGLPVKLDLNMEADEDLKSLHGDPAFASILAEAKKRALAAKATAPGAVQTAK